MKTAALLMLLFSGLAHAQTWQTDPRFGARPNAFGPGVHMDATGRPYRDQAVGGGTVLQPVQPNAYGLGVGMDATGRPVRPNYDLNGGFPR